jgi:HSP20 family protein
MFGLIPRGRERRAERALTRREYTPFDLLRREFATLFDRAFGGWPIPFEPPWEPMAPWGFELEEKEEEVVVKAEVPGFEASELEVEVRGDLLMIRAEHKEEVAEKEEKPIEHRYGKLERTVTLPPGVEPDKIEARLHNGVLEVHVPKAPGVKPRRIEVKV